MELRTYVVFARKWWWLCLAAMVTAGASAAGYTLLQSPIYQTRATIMVGNSINNPNPDTRDFYLAQQLLATYADIVKRQVVRAATLESLGMDSLPLYSTRAVPNTQLLEITVTDTDPARAQAVANELVNQMILLSPAGRDGQRRQEFVTAQLDKLETNIAESEEELERKQAELAQAFGAVQIAEMEKEVAALRNKLVTLQANYASLLANTQQGAANTINVVEYAALPVLPSGPNLRQNVILACLAGLALAIGLGFVIDHMDDSLKNPDDVSQHLSMNTLAAIRAAEAGASEEGELITLTNTRSPGTEAFRVLRTNLQFAAVDHALQKLMVTSPAPGDGKSTVASNLGIVMAQGGKRVILVDADLHRPRLHRHFQLVNNMGVTTALVDERARVRQHLQAASVPNLHVMTSGPLPPNPAELLGSARMQALLTELQREADVVIVDSPPVTALADAAVLSTQMDGVLLVVRAGKTRRELAQRALDALLQVHARVLGVVINRMPTRGAGYYSNYYYHRYGEYYVTDDGGTPRRRRTRRPSPQPAGSNGHPAQAVDAKVEDS